MRLGVVEKERDDLQWQLTEWKKDAADSIATFKEMMHERDEALARVAVLEGALVYVRDCVASDSQKTWAIGDLRQTVIDALSQSPSEALASGHSARSQEYRKSISPEQEAAVRMAQLQLSTIVNRCHQTVAGDREIATEALKALTDAFGEGEGAL